MSRAPAGSPDRRLASRRPGAVQAADDLQPLRVGASAALRAIGSWRPDGTQRGLPPTACH